MSGMEPFPLLNTSADQLRKADADGARRRRKSSGLGGEIRAGDTGAPALASSKASLDASDYRVCHFPRPFNRSYST